MTIIYFDDLAKTKNVVLEMAEIDATNLKPEEAKFLVHQMKSYYLNSNESDDKYNLLNTFMNAPGQFKHTDLVKQVEKDNLKLDQFKQEQQK
jgi:ATP synthase F1 complex assembly factor 1